MEHETGPRAFLHSLIPLEDFKAILGIDDREDKISAFCLLTATFTIEQYCKRRLLLKKHVEHVEHNGDPLLPLREYPVREILALYALGYGVAYGVAHGVACGTGDFAGTGEMVEPEYYRVIPDLEGETGKMPDDTVYSLSLSPALLRGRGFTTVKAVYRAVLTGKKYTPPKGTKSLNWWCLAPK
jgi:hypothetical protein